MNKIEISAKLIKAYESEQEFIGEKELMEKGIILDDLDHHLRCIVKHDIKDLSKELKIPHSNVVKMCEYIRKWIVENK